MRYSRLLLLSIAVVALLVHWSQAIEPPDESQQTQFQKNFEELQIIEQGLARTTSPILPHDAVKLQGAMKARVEKLLGYIGKHSEWNAPVPTSIDHFEKSFWILHVLDNQLTSVSRYFDYANHVLAIAKKHKFKTNEVYDASASLSEWRRLKTEMGSLRDKHQSRDMELRIARVKLADKLLSESKDTAERLLSALALDLDDEALKKSLPKNDIRIQEVQEVVDHAKNMAGKDLLKKSRLLFAGLHWWFRGRYGAGTAAGGFLKDAASLKSPSIMFGLMMPIEQPIPTAPGTKESVPSIDRRHHYLWQLESRRITSGSSWNVSIGQKEYVPQYGTAVTLSQFY